jgi:hypothetical protein
MSYRLVKKHQLLQRLPMATRNLPVLKPHENQPIAQ